MDINLDAAPTATTTAGEPISPSGTTPSTPLTTSSLTWPNQYSGVPSSTSLPSDMSATIAVATSSYTQASSVATSISQQFPKSSFKNSLQNKNNNTSSSRSSSFQNDTNHKYRNTSNSLEPNESLNTKVVRKR